MVQRVLSDLAMVARLTKDLPRFLRTPVNAEQAAAVVKHRLVTRREQFLRMLDRAVYNHPKSPYLQLLQAAGCELGDIRAMVCREGVEGALSRLHEAGVYVTFDELKGRSEIIRGSQRFTVAQEDFDNPGLVRHFEVRTGGTRGPGSSIKADLAWLVDEALQIAVALQAHELYEADHAIWMTGPIIPLYYAKAGCRPIAWYSPLKALPLQVLVGCWYLAAISRLAGCPLPKPAFLDLQDSAGMALWLAGRLRRGRSIGLFTRPSGAVRVAAAATEMGISLAGVCLMVGGEPFTEANQRTVEASGARRVVRYAFWEAGVVGYSCADAQVSDDVHCFTHRFAVIQRPRTVDGSSVSVDAFLFSSFFPTTPKVLLNLESGDYGIVERRDCGCQLGALGLKDHLSQIRSFEKLTGEGMTFVKTQLLSVLQEVLPARFGGTSADYQVVEQEDADGILRLYLLVSPRIGAVDEAELKRTFLAELGGEGMVEAYMARIWERAGTVEVRRQTPVATGAGKVFPFQLIKSRVLDKG